MDYNQPIELTDTSTGLDLLNETRRKFSLRINQVVDDVANIPVDNQNVAHLLSQHIMHRLQTMQMLTILTPEEVEAATACIQRRMNGDEPYFLVFAPVQHSGYIKYTVSELMGMWRELLQDFLEFSLKKVCTYPATEQAKIVSFAKIATLAASEVDIISSQEYDTCTQILQDIEHGNQPNTYTFLS